MKNKICISFKNISKENKINIVLFCINLLISILFYLGISLILNYIGNISFITLIFVIALILFTTPFIFYLKGHRSYSIFKCFINGISFFLINYLNFTFYTYTISAFIPMCIYAISMVLIISIFITKHDN